MVNIPLILNEMIQTLLNIGTRIVRLTVRQHCAEIRRRAIMRTGDILGAMACFAVSMTLILMVAVFIGIGVVRLLEMVMASHWAYLSVAGVYVLLYVIVRVFRRRLFYRPIQRFLFRIFDSEGQ